MSSEKAIYDQIHIVLNIYFPENPNSRPSWQQDKNMMFDVFLESLSVLPHIHGDMIKDDLRENWFPARGLGKQDAKIVFEICDAWSEWLYAVENFSMDSDAE